MRSRAPSRALARNERGYCGSAIALPTLGEDLLIYSLSLSLSLHCGNAMARFRASSRDPAHVHARVHVVVFPCCGKRGSSELASRFRPRRRLLIRGVWFSFALQFNPPGIPRDIHVSYRSRLPTCPHYTIVLVVVVAFPPTSRNRRLRQGTPRDSPKYSDHPEVEARRRVHCLQLRELIWIKLM